MSSTTWSYAQDFRVSFHASRSDLEGRLAALKSTGSDGELQSVTVDLAKLTKSLTDASGSLPSFDQRQCELGLRALEGELEAIRAATAPKSKFAFKRKAKAPGTVSPAPPTPAPALEPLSTPTLTAAASTTHITLASHTRRYLTIASLPLPGDPSQPSAARDLTIADLDGCIVDLLPREPALGGKVMEFGALHIRNIRNSVLLLPRIRGSALLHDMERCVVVVGSHQFRMHASTAIDVYLGVPSLPVIEHCARIRFGPYPPSSLLPLIPVAPEEPIGEGKYREVQDFSHVRATPSPNWSILPQGEGAGCKVLTDSQQLEGDGEVKDGSLMEGILPPTLA